MAYSTEARIARMRRMRPSRLGMCARTVWLSLGVPKLGVPDASSAARKIRARGKLHANSRPSDAPRGSIMLWTGGGRGHGHMALSLGKVNGVHRTLSTDAGPRNGRRGSWVADVPTSWISKNWSNLRWAGWTTWYGQQLPTPTTYTEPPYPGRLARKSKGPAVKAIQKHLGVVTTGYFGDLTHTAVRKFQRTRPALWPADGVVGPKTYAAILKRKVP